MLKTPDIMDEKPGPSHRLIRHSASVVLDHKLGRKASGRRECHVSQYDPDLGRRKCPQICLYSYFKCTYDFGLRLKIQVPNYGQLRPLSHISGSVALLSDLHLFPDLCWRCPNFCKLVCRYSNFHRGATVNNHHPSASHFTFILDQGLFAILGPFRHNVLAKEKHITVGPRFSDILGGERILGKSGWALNRGQIPLISYNGGNLSCH
eukprot:sb/3470368/